MRRFARPLVALSIALIACAPGQAPTVASPSEALVRRFLQAQERVMQAAAGDAEIQEVLSLLSDSVVYEHPRARATITGREAYGSGLRGFLGSTRNPTIAVVHLLVSGPIVAVEQRVTFEVQRDGVWQPQGRTQVTVFDIEDERIARIVDFWQPLAQS